MPTLGFTAAAETAICAAICLVSVIDGGGPSSLYLTMRTTRIGGSSLSRYAAP